MANPEAGQALLERHRKFYSDMPLEEYLDRRRAKYYPDMTLPQYVENLGLVAPDGDGVAEAPSPPASPSTMERIGEAGWDLLPSATTMMGGLRGAQMGARGGPLGVAIGGILGAATGGAVGEAGKEAAFDGGGPGDIFSAGAEGAKTGAESEMLGGIVSKPLLGALQWAKAPALKAWEAAGDGAKLAMGRFRDAGLRFNPNQIAKSPTGTMVHKLAASSEVGAEIMNLGNAKLREQLAEEIDLFQKSVSRMRGELIGKELDLPDVIGVGTKDIIGVGKPVIEEKITAAYDIAKGLAPSDTLIKVPKIRQTMGALLQNPVFAGNKQAVKFLKGWLKKTEETGMMSLQDLDRFQSKINTETGASKNATGAEGLFRAFADDLTGWDKEVGAEIAEAYGTARATAREKYGFDAVAAIFNKATRLTADLTAEVFSPPVAKAVLNSKRKEIIRVYGVEKGNDLIAKIAAYIDLAADSAGKTKTLTDQMNRFSMPVTSSSKLLGGTGTTYGMAYIGYRAAGIPGAAVGIVLPWGTSKAAAASLMNPKGYMNRWLSSTKKLTPEFKTRLNRAIVMGAYEGLDDD